VAIAIPLAVGPPPLVNLGVARGREFNLVLSLFVSEIPYFWISAIETKTHLDFPEQIIACHARHSVICNNKIRFHFLEKHKKKQRNSLPLVQISRKNKKKKGMESQRQTERERDKHLAVGWLAALKWPKGDFFKKNIYIIF
jgi:hypothetical protein